MEYRIHLCFVSAFSNTNLITNFYTSVVSFCQFFSRSSVRGILLDELFKLLAEICKSGPWDDILTREDCVSNRDYFPFVTVQAVFCLHQFNVLNPFI